MPSFAWAAARDPLDEQTWRSIVAGVSTRPYATSLDAVPEALQERSTSRSAVSRRFVAQSQRQLTTCLSRPLGDLDLQVVMVDGIDYHDHAILVALGIDARGIKHVLGVREGTTENSTVAGALLSELVAGSQRSYSSSTAGRRSERQFAACSGPPGWCNAVRATSCGTCSSTYPRTSVPRCGTRCGRPTRPRPRQPRRSGSSSGWRARWTPPTSAAAASLREGLEETLTLQALGIMGALWQTLRSTNPIEDLNGAPIP